MGKPTGPKPQFLLNGYLPSIHMNIGLNRMSGKSVWQEAGVRSGLRLPTLIPPFFPVAEGPKPDPLVCFACKLFFELSTFKVVFLNV